MIPEGLYLFAEKKRRNRRKMMSVANEQLAKAKERASSMPGGIGSITGGTGGIPQSRTEKAALAVIRAEAGVERAKRWERVFRTMDEIYPASTEEGSLAVELYDNGKSMQSVCEKLALDRQTIRRRRDRYIYRLILLAAADGLISRNEMK